MNRFTIIEHDRVVLVEGALAPRWVQAIAAVLPKDAVISPDLARMMGVNFAFGLLDDINAMIIKVRLQVEEQLRKVYAGRLSEPAIKWLASGERGTSSNTLFTRLTGIDAMDGSAQSHPYDPADFRRCRLLVEQCSELLALLPLMSSVSDEWAGLVASWTDICTTMDAEVPDWRTTGGNAPKTYQLIKTAIAA